MVLTTHHPLSGNAEGSTKSLMASDRDFRIFTLRPPAGFADFCIPAVLLFLLLLVAYANSFQGTWVFDDALNIIDNKNVHLEDLSPASLKASLYGLKGGLARPLAYLSFGINHYFGGTDVFGYHLVNFSIHFLTSLFLFLFILKTLKLPLLREYHGPHAYSTALLAAVFWALNPIQVTAVTYIVQRMASMAGLFYITSMYFYLLGRTAGARRRQVLFFSLASMSAVLAFGSKENAAMLPVSVFLYELFLIQGVSRAAIKRGLALAAMPLGVVVVLGLLHTDPESILSGYERRPFTLGERLLTEPRIILFYISLLLYPIGNRLALLHQVEVSTGLLSPAATLISIAAVAGAAAFALVRSRKNPLLSFCILFFFLNHLIESSFIPLELIYEHRNYIPSFFFFVPIAVLIVRSLRYFSHRRVIRAGIVLLVIVVWVDQGRTVYDRNELFADPPALWRDNAGKAPGLSRVHINLGNALFDEGSYEKAYQAFLRARELDYYQNATNEGVLYYNLSRYYFHAAGDLEKAFHNAETARAIYPGLWNTWYYSAISALALGRADYAEALAFEASKAWPENELFPYIRGLSRLRQGDHDGCGRIAREALANNMDPPKFYKLLGAARLKEGFPAAASKYLGFALDAEPGDREALFALVEAYHRSGDHQARDETVERLTCLKKGGSWEDFLRAAARDNPLNAYFIDPAALLPVIRESLQGMAP